MTTFSVDDRVRVRDRVLELAASDERVVAGAVVGSLAHDDGDRWSDLDLTFGVADDLPVMDVLIDWTRNLVDEFDAVHLFDLPSGATIYRVSLLPGCLQFDLSFTPASAFGAGGPKFRLLFGKAAEKPYARPPSAHELFGYAVHHALRARFCIERGPATGKRSTGSAAFVTTPSASRAVGATFPQCTAGASTTSPLTCGPASPMRSYDHRSEPSCFARSAARSPDCCAKQMKFGSSLRRSNLSYTR